MRTRKSAINILAGITAQLLAVIFAFIVKRVFVTNLGYELLGITTLFSTLISMLGLAELGLGTAVSYVLYTLIGQNDTAKITSYMHFLRRIYGWLSFAVFVLGLIFVPFLPRMIKGTYAFFDLAVLFIPFVISASVSYLFSYRKLLIMADQNGYILSVLQIAYRLVTNTLQLLIIVFYHNYMLYLYIKIAFDLLENMVASMICVKKYPFVSQPAEKLSREDTMMLRKNVYALAFHKIGAYAVSGTDMIIISGFLGSRMVAFCSGYVMLIDTVAGFLAQIFSGIASSVGNMLVLEDDAHVMHTFRKMLLAQHLIVSFCCVALSVLLTPFVGMWLGQDAMLSKWTVSILVFNFFVVAMSQPIGTLRASAGVFQPDRYLHIGLALLNLVISLLLVKPFGAIGVYLGTAACLIVKEVIVLPHIVSRYIVKNFSVKYYKELFLYTGLTVCMVVVCLYMASILSLQNIYFKFILQCFICAAVPNIVNVALFHRTDLFRELLSTVYGLAKNASTHKRLGEKVMRYRYILFFVFFAILVVFGLHGFSLSSWDLYFKNAPGLQSGVLFGRPNPITSDVWSIIVPQIMSQEKLGFPFYNKDIMLEGANAILYGLPAWDIAILGRPCLWGFLFFGMGRGLAFMYWFRIFGLLIGGYKILQYMTGNHTKLSIIGAFLLAFGSMSQWWVGHILPELLMSAQLIIVGLIVYAGHLKSAKHKMVALALIFIFSLNFLMAISPAVQVSIGYMVLIFAVCIVLTHRQAIKRCLTWKDYVVFGAVLATVAIIAVRFFYVSQNEISLILHTDYPGQRISVGGEYPPGKFFYYVYQWMIPFVGSMPYNNCESSMFLPFWPIVFLSAPFLLFHKKEKKLLPILLYAYMVFCTSWLFVVYPVLFAKVTLFSFVTDKRILWAIGSISIYLGIYSVHVLDHDAVLKRKKSILLQLALFLLFLAISIYGKDMLAVFDRLSFLGAHGVALVKVGVVFVTLAGWAFFHWAFLNRKTKLVCCLLTGVVLACGLFINPLMAGNGAIENKQIVRAIGKIERNDPNAFWVYNGEFPKSLILTAAKVKNFNAANLYPDFRKWDALDKDRLHREVYNRYAHTSVDLTNQGTTFSLKAEDAIFVTLTPKDIQTLDISYIVSEKRLNESEWNSKEIYFDELDQIWIYQCKRV